MHMLSEIFYASQKDNTPLHLAARGGHTTCVEHLFSTTGIDVNIKNEVSGRSIALFHLYTSVQLNHGDVQVVVREQQCTLQCIYSNSGLHGTHIRELNLKYKLFDEF